ncbi:hypothetical protein THAOC_17490 [Thalassiosira oceanica]|uniref:Peptidase S59 domain-containing protein n=1 Tax=Thalassiosira oceanica TaxID=159749 RepID=K0S9G7_THAOC|nr:hypothetical protein THAOC_17490 [Thalassiosira oceanica]|eukprot:EJK61940.1 hypothetical protein THAOC_17490 [Thalassiosira oceanica]
MFGAPSTPFGQQNTGGSAFGGFGQQQQQSTGFGQPQQSAGFGFGTQNNNNTQQSGGFGSSGFGSTTASTGFGSSGFGAPAPSAFGQPAPSAPSGGLFGSSAPAPAFGQTSAFGAKPSGSLFGGSAPGTPAFGQPPAPSGGLFGGGAPAPAFGQSTAGSGGLFSSTPAPAFGAAPSTGLFGQPQQQQQQLQQQQTGSTVAPYSATPKQDGNNSITLHSITSMPQYEAKSFEELRLEDYLNNNKGTKGQNPPATGFGGFGAPAPAFGQPAPAPASGGLFGSTPAPAFGSTASGGFGSSTPAPATGLFGQPAPAAGGFGQPAPSTGLFGQQPAPSTGLFGSTTPAAPAGGLFGGSSAPAPATGLFGQQPATGGFGQAAAPATGLFGSSTPAPSTGLFGQSTAPPATGLFGAPAAPSTGLFGQQQAKPGGLFTQSTSAPAGGSIFGAPPASVANNAVPQIPPPSADAVLAQQLAAVENQKKQLELLDAWRGKPSSASKVIPSSQYDADSGNGLNYTSSTLLPYRAAPRSAAKIRPRGYASSNASPGVASLGRKGGSPILSPNRFVGSATKSLFIKPDSMTPKPKTRLLLTNGTASPPSGSVLENGAADSPNVPTQVLTNGSTKQQHNAGDAKIERPTVPGSPPSVPTQAAARHLVPKLTKAGYTIHPPMNELESMSEADLTAVSGFKVERPGFGSVSWDGAVDVRGVDVDTSVVIEAKNVSVYDDEEEKGEKPPRGTKLNRPAVIIMNDIYPKDGPESSHEAKEKLKRKIDKSTKKMNAELLSFDADAGVWTFRVGHFSRYGLSEDEDSDEETEVAVAPSDTDSINLEDLGGASKMFAPMNEDESATTSSQLGSDMGEPDRDEKVLEVLDAADDAYNMITEELNGEREVAIIQYEPIDEDDEEAAEEEMVMFPQDEIPITAPPRRPLRPAHPVARSSSSICTKLAAKAGVSSSSIDYGLRMGRSFRPGDRILFQSKPLISSPVPNGGSPTLRMMQAHKKHAVASATTFCLPKFPEDDQLILDDYAKSSNTEVGESIQSPVSGAFSLLSVLYGEDKLSEEDKICDGRRAVALSSWLKDIVADETHSSSKDYEASQQPLHAIFAALSGGDVSKASSLALECGNPRLSLMLASLGIDAHAFAKSQLDSFELNGCQSDVPVSIIRALADICSDLSVERQRFQSDPSQYDVSWRQRFGMELSADDVANSVSSHVKKYQAQVDDGLAPRPSPLYCESNEDNDVSCIFWQILKHFSKCEGISLANIIDPSTHTALKHDFSSSFHLGSALASISTVSLTKHQEFLVIESLVSQLIAEGSQDWAVYACLCSIVGDEIDCAARKVLARKIVERYPTTSLDTSIAEIVTDEWLIHSTTTFKSSLYDTKGALETCALAQQVTKSGLDYVERKAGENIWRSTRCAAILELLVLLGEVEEVEITPDETALDIMLADAERLRDAFQSSKKQDFVNCSFPKLPDFCVSAELSSYAEELVLKIKALKNSNNGPAAVWLPYKMQALREECSVSVIDLNFD